jgi:hypothetical protein
MMEDTDQNKEVNKTTRSLQNLLGGGFLANKKTTENLPFFLFLAFLAIIYIGNSFYAEKNIRKIERLEKEMKELRYEHIYMRSKLMSKSRQSEVAESLSDLGIKASRTPPGRMKAD